ncbi:MAG: hypothetical protein WBG54_04155 [Acidobacteriaceae bacterium]
MNALRALPRSCVMLLVVFIFACGRGLSQATPAVPAGTASSATLPSTESRKWVNPCSSDATATQALPGSVCSFLIETYAEIDKRCGLIPAHRFWPPSHWHTYPAYEIIPNEVAMNVKGHMGMATDPFVFSDKISLATLLTSVTTISGNAALKMLIDNEDAIVVVPPGEVTSNLYKLDFDPRIDPATLNEDQYSSSTRIVSCDNALKASENGSVQVAIAKASEQFSAQADDAQSMKLTSGTFRSSMDWLAQEHPNAFYYEALDLYRRQIQANVAPPPALYYISQVDGIVRYLSDKGNAQTDVTATADASYSVGIGGISGSASGDHSTQNSNSATIYTVMLRNAVTTQLPTPAQVLAYFAGAPSAIFDPRSPLSSEPAFDKTTGKVRMSRAMPGVTSSLCKNELWSFPSGSTFDLSMSMKEDMPTPASATTSPVRKPRKVCVATITTSPDTFSTSSDFIANLQFNVDPTKVTPTPFAAGTTKGTYTQPNAQLSVLTNTPAPMSDQVWYQIGDPSQVDKTRSPTFDATGTGQGLTCDGKPVTVTVYTVAYSDSYTPPGGSKVTGTFITILVNFAAQNAPTSCQLNGKLKLTGANGAPITLAVPRLIL